MKKMDWMIVTVLAMFVSAEIAEAQNQLKVVGFVNIAGRKAGTKDFNRLGSGKYFAHFEGIRGSAQSAIAPQTNTPTTANNSTISFPGKMTIGPICADSVATLTVGNGRFDGPAICAVSAFCPAPWLLKPSSGIVVGGLDYGILSIGGINYFSDSVYVNDNLCTAGTVSAKEFVCQSGNGDVKISELVKKIEALEAKVAELEKSASPAQ
jgi:hypothetical protein